MVDSSMFVVGGILAVLLLAALMVLATAQRRATTGRLSHETRKADASIIPATTQPAARSADRVIDEAARTRADETRRATGSVTRPPARRGTQAVAEYEPVSDEELGITRRQFFNRGILAGLVLGLSTFGVAALGFLWPSGGGGFGGKVDVGGLDDINTAFQNKQPYYNAGAKAYVVPYPKQDAPKAKKIAGYTSAIIAGMQEGYVALYQRCPHLGCRVPFCSTSQWFECPCHGSKYNRVGEKRGGPAPRGMDRFPFEISGGRFVVDTGVIVQGPPIGTDTTGQAPEGPPCV